MRTIIIISLCFMALLKTKITSGYLIDPFYARTFGLFNLFQPQQNNLVTRISTLEGTVESLGTQIAPLSAQIAPVPAQITALQNQIQTLSRLTTALINNFSTLTSQGLSCPSAVAATGRVIGNNCYTLGTTAKPFTSAQQDCQANGGNLAEPVPADVTSNSIFYNAIKNAFSPAFATTIGISNLYVGIKRPAGIMPLTFFTNGVTVPTSLFETTPGAGAAALTTTAVSPEAAVLEPSGLYLNVLQSASNFYICQYNTVI